MQQEITIDGSYDPVFDILNEYKSKKLFLICDGAYDYLKIKPEMDKLKNIVRFSDFTPNPDYDSVKQAVSLYKSENCDSIIAIGGGSAIDLAKCVKSYVSMSDKKEYIEQTIHKNNIRLIVMPTTAGTGSEATRYAVIYYKGNKQSIAHESLIPNAVIFDPTVLETLPDYQRKSTMMDALCHAIESFWSVNSTDESKTYSNQAIQLILNNMDNYLNKVTEVNKNMLLAANLAGKAINIAQTTAGHAMSYKLTSLYGISHGHAVALCVSALLPYMIANTNDCIDIRGETYYKSVLCDIAHALHCDNIEEISKKFLFIVNKLGLGSPIATKTDYELLKKSVNTTRLKNNPIKLDTHTIDILYHKILK